MIPPFDFARIPHIIFGAGKLNELYSIIQKFGKNVLIVKGARSLNQSNKWDEIISALKDNSINFSSIFVSGEPSPVLIDGAVSKLKNKNFDLVIGIGGGSVMDAGKAISAMLTKGDSIKNYLEGIGNKTYDGKKIPYIAIPTTSGTGSEATKNAVISEIGPSGYKKSLRHDNLIPNIALIDPELMISCPTSVTASCGMDAFTQLLEAYVSSKGSPITNMLAYNGIKYMNRNLILVSSTGASDVAIRSTIAYGSLMSGIALANAGLGIIHGLASSIGGFFNIPHGVVCGTLLAEVTKMNIKVLQESNSAGKKGLKKYADIGGLLLGKISVEKTRIDEYCISLINTLEKWTQDLKINRLGKYNIKIEDVEKIIKNTGLKNNPVNLSEENLRIILGNRI